LGGEYTSCVATISVFSDPEVAVRLISRPFPMSSPIKTPFEFYLIDHRCGKLIFEWNGEALWTSIME